MELTSTAFFALTVAVALLVPVGVVWIWRRPTRSPWRLAAVAACVVVAQVAALGAAAVGVNRQFGFYPTWDSLFGQPVPPPVVAQGNPLGLGVAGSDLRYSVPGLETMRGGGSYREYTITGRSSHITQKVVAWLPPQYGNPRYAKDRFPVLMVLGGAYVSVNWVAGQLGFDRVATTAITHGRVAPFVALFPEINVENLRVDTECTDIPHGAQSFTWLQADVPHWARSELRVSADPRHWSAMGWSTGGYCAAKLHLRDPHQFVAAASIEGYFAPELDRTTGNLATIFKNQIRLAEQNSPTWLVEHHPPQATHLLVVSSPADPQSWPQSSEFLRRAHLVPGVQPYLVPDLGHTVGAWQLVLPPVLGWLAAVANL